MLSIKTDKTTRISNELISKGAEAIIGSSKTTGVFTGVVFPDATITAGAVKKCLTMISKDIGDFRSNRRYYDDDVTNRKYAQHHFTKQSVSMVVEKTTLTVYSNMGNKHMLMFFPFLVNKDDEEEYIERLHQCMMSYRTENNLKNMHFKYCFCSDDGKNFANTNLYTLMGKKEVEKNKKGRVTAKTSKTTYSTTSIDENKISSEACEAFSPIVFGLGSKEEIKAYNDAGRMTNLKGIHNFVTKHADMSYINKAGKKKQFTAGNRIRRFLDCYKLGFITEEELIYLAGITKEDLKAYIAKSLLR